ncbi:glycoside hydrolase family 18 [Alistipes finegoldii]|uniref:glycoside hydrolase family 18 n=1 Tax=Alistipes finegoldii TaxID=214856 RepID=UPI002494C9B6|nr:glycoside hydrolase family 18 [Alistipes finegoldii]
MKNIFIAFMCMLFAGGGFVSCEKYNEPKALTIQKPDVKSPDYYANLRAYKASKHPVSFGWFGGWTGQGPSMKNFMRSLPDSVDIISLWSGNPDTEASQADLDFVQQVKGTRVCACLLLGWVGKGLSNEEELKGTWPEDREEALRLYADRLAQQYIANGYHGFDIDYEPGAGGIDASGCPKGEDFLHFVDQLGKYFGPKSGTDRLLMIDGELDAPLPECAPYFNYAIAQTYGSNSVSCQNKYDELAHLYKPEQFIVTENFELYWQDGQKILEQAGWNPIQGTKGGAGAYHMEKDYDNAGMQYKWLRQAIQIMNPAIHTADGSYRPAAYFNLNAKNEDNIQVLHTPGGDFVDKEIAFPISCSQKPSGDVAVALVRNDALIDAYNLAHGTSCQPVPDGVVEIVNSSITIAAGEVVSADKVKIDFTGDLSKILTSETSGYLLPLEITSVQGGGTTTSRDRNIVYIVITAVDTDSMFKAVGQLTGAEAIDRSGWSADSDLPTNIGNLFDGKDSSKWPSTLNKQPDYLIVDMGKKQSLKGIEFRPYNKKNGYGIIQIFTSDDGATWQNQGKATLNIDNNFVEFFAPMSFRYFKVVAETYNNKGFTGYQFGLIEINAFQ